jgi:RNA polymerase sigma-70 factor (sigma-E family)
MRVRVPCRSLRPVIFIWHVRPTGNIMAAISLSGLPGVFPAGEPCPVRPRPGAGRTARAGGGWGAGEALTEIYSAEYGSLVRMAASLVSDIGTAEEVVQETFVATQGAWPQLRDSDKLLAYVRQSVMNRARSVIRRRMVVDRHPPKHEPDAPSAEYIAIAELERSAVMSALRLLPERQREVLVLRFYLGLREGQIAAALGISKGTVKVHTRRAMTAMRDTLAPAAGPATAGPALPEPHTSRTAA